MMRPGGDSGQSALAVFVNVGQEPEERVGRKCGGEDPERKRERERGKSGQQKLSFSDGADSDIDTYNSQTAARKAEG